MRPAVKLSSFQAKAVGDSVTVNTDGVILYIIIIQSQDSYTGDSFIFPSGESFGFNSELSAVPNSTFSGSINLRLDENSGKLSVERIIFGDSWTYFLIEVFGIIQPN